jgi:hypothetical protein
LTGQKTLDIHDRLAVPNIEEFLHLDLPPFISSYCISTFAKIGQLARAPVGS